MNKIIIAGQVASKPTFSHEFCGEKFYQCEVITARKSETYDIIPCVISEALLPRINNKVAINGEIRSRNIILNNKNKTQLYVFAFELFDYEKDENYVELEGNICVQPTYRQTPLGQREVSDVIIASNRERNGKSDYIPCICWGRTAVRMSELPVGTKVSLTGRFQSRTYTKAISDTEMEIRTAYELSANVLEVL